MYRARYRRIVWFFGRIITGFIFWDLFLPQLGLGKWSGRNRSYRMQQSAVRFRHLAIQMGGVMIKVGQFLSTRVDIFPPEITNVLTGLQDEVPPVPYKDIQKVIESEFGAPVEEFFAKFDISPLAAASLGQVHAAELHAPVSIATNISSEEHISLIDLKNVVVKVQRPDIEKIISTDLKALQTVANWLQRYKPISRRANVPALLDEFSKILYEEIDYHAEGRNAETFSANFKNQANVRVPRVIWSHTTKRVLSLENVYAIKITDYEAITKAGINRSEVASRLLNTYLQQIFVDGFFHADPHPGNLFVDPCPDGVKIPIQTPGQEILPNSGDVLNGRSWQLTFVDFGMVGRIPTNLYNGLRELLISVGTRDSARMIHAFQKMDILLPGADLETLQRAGEHIFERYWGMNMSELTNLDMNDFYQFADEFRELIYDLPFQIPQNLIYLVRTVNILSGMCTGLDPKFNVFAHIIPFTKQLTEEEARTNPQNWLNEIQNLGKSWLNFPLRLDTLINKLERGEIAVRTPEISQQLSRLVKANRQVSLSIIFAALLVVGIQLWLAEQVIFGSVTLAAAGFCLLWMLIIHKLR